MGKKTEGANPLDRAFGPAALLRFALPTVGTMLFMGLYTVVDTLFIARLVGTDALSAVNIVCPVINLTVGLGTMLATGGSALVAREMGAGNALAARRKFTLLALFGGALGVLIALGGLLFLPSLIRGLGASDRLYPYCRDYLAVILLFTPAGLGQVFFQNLLVTAGRPGLGLALTLGSGCANALLDWLFIVPGKMGVAGAALGTGIGYAIPVAAGLWFFARDGGSLRFARPGGGWQAVAESCRNGCSEMVGQLAAAVTTFLFNAAMMARLGEEGVAAITVLIYSQFVLSTLYIGFSMGVAPVISYQYGRGDRSALARTTRLALGAVGLSSLAVFAAALLGGGRIAALFAGEDLAVANLAAEGFSLFAYSFLFSGINLFSSAYFTALSDGRTSALLSFLRTFGLLAPAILYLPRVWGRAGIWLAVPLAEGGAFLCSTFCLWRQRRRLEGEGTVPSAPR